MKDKNIDEILMRALHPDDEPEHYLNQNILQSAKEKKDMRKFKKIPVALIAAAIVATVSCIGVAATLIFLSPDEVAEQANDNALAQAFTSSDAVSINQTKTFGGKSFTLMGLVSGKDISDYPSMANNEIKSDRTYCVLAIANTDGTPIDAETADFFFVSPYIEGYNPAMCNICTLHGAGVEVYADGCQYRIVECDNIEVFADHNIKLGVNSGMLYDHSAFNFDEATGSITSVEGYEQLNLLFDLPLDESKADPTAAAEYIDEIFNG